MFNSSLLFSSVCYLGSVRDQQTCNNLSTIWLLSVLDSSRFFSWLNKFEITCWSLILRSLFFLLYPSTKRPCRKQTGTSARDAGNLCSFTSGWHRITLGLHITSIKTGEPRVLVVEGVSIFFPIITNNSICVLGRVGDQLLWTFCRRLFLPMTQTYSG